MNRAELLNEYLSSIKDFKAEGVKIHPFEDWLVERLSSVTAERDRAREELAEANKIIDMKINTNRHLSEMNAYLAKKCDMKEPTHD